MRTDASRVAAYVFVDHDRAGARAGL